MSSIICNAWLGGDGVCTEPGQPQLPALSGTKRIHEGSLLHQLPQVPAVLAGAAVCQVGEVYFKAVL